MEDRWDASLPRTKYFKYQQKHRDAVIQLVQEGVPYSKIHEHLNEMFVADGVEFRPSQVRGLIKAAQKSGEIDKKMKTPVRLLPSVRHKPRTESTEQQKSTVPTCSQCGGNLSFNSTMRIYECDGCGRACWIFERKKDE